MFCGIGALKASRWTNTFSAPAYPLQGQEVKNFGECMRGRRARRHVLDAEAKNNDEKNDTQDT